MNVKHEEHSGNVLRELNKLRERAELTDVVLEVEGRSFPCHHAVLASCSPYFRTMFTSGYAETKQERICIQNLIVVAMATILDYTYTGHIQTEPDQVQAVMCAARLLQVDFICHQAAEYMRKHLDVSNCVDVLMYADMLGDYGLVEASETHIASRFNQVALQPSFLQLSLPLLKSVLNSNDLMTNSEDDVVQAALRWINFNQEERSQHLPALCKTFRRSFISSEKLAEIESKRLSTDIKLVYSKSTIQRQGQVRTEMQILPKVPIEVQDDLMDGSYSRWSAPCYDPSTGGLDVIDMPRNLGSFSLTSTPDDLYLAGGRRGKIVQKAFYQYNHLLETWEPRCEMISARVGCGLVYLKGYIYAIGGYKTKGTAERYDPSTDEWTSIPPMPNHICRSLQFCTVTLDDSIYVISKEGCYSFSTTENKWSKIADMIAPPVHPQVVSYHGRIFCMDCDVPSAISDPTCVEMYNPADGMWKQSGNGETFEFRTASLMKHSGSLYLITVHLEHECIFGQSTQRRINIHQYQTDTDSWLYLQEKGRLVPPLAYFKAGHTCTGRADCLMARMIHRSVYEGTTNESQHDPSDQDDSDEEKSDND